jgi:hypothetical protein
MLLSASFTEYVPKCDPHDRLAFAIEARSRDFTADSWKRLQGDVFSWADHPPHHLGG